MPDATTYTCGRCDTEFPLTADHTEIIRRDFVDIPHPSRIDRLCRDCWRVYVEEFLGRDFEDVLDEYGARTESPRRE